MNIIHKLCISILAVALFLSVSADYYKQRPDVQDFRYAKIVTSITSYFSENEVGGMPKLTTSNYVVTEERGIIFCLIACVLLTLFSLLFIVLGRLKFGASKYDVTIISASCLILFWISSIIYNSGIYIYL